MLLPTLNTNTGIILSLGRSEYNTNRPFETTTIPSTFITNFLKSKSFLEDSNSTTTTNINYYDVDNDQNVSESYEIDVENTTSSIYDIEEDYEEDDSSNNGGELEYDLNIDLELKRRPSSKRSIKKRNIEINTTEPSYVYDNENLITTTTNLYDYSEDYSDMTTTSPIIENTKQNRISPEHEALYNLLTTRAYQLLTNLNNNNNNKNSGNLNNFHHSKTYFLNSNKKKVVQNKFDITDLASLIGLNNLDGNETTTTTTSTKNMNLFNIDNFQSLLFTTKQQQQSNPFDFFKPFNPSSNSSSSGSINLSNLNDLSNLSGLFNLLGQTTTTTTSRSPAFNFEDFGNLLPGLGGGGSTNANPLSILNLINGGGTNGGSNALSLLGLLSGSSANSLAAIAPFLNLLPLNQLLSDPQTSFGLISSIPQIINLVQAYSNFKLPETDGKNADEILRQWTIFVGDQRAQVINIVQILTNIGQIKPSDSKLIQAILSANIETITNPDVIGKYD